MTPNNNFEMVLLWLFPYPSTKWALLLEKTVNMTPVEVDNLKELALKHLQGEQLTGVAYDHLCEFFTTHIYTIFVSLIVRTDPYSFPWTTRRKLARYTSDVYDLAAALTGPVFPTKIDHAICKAVHALVD